MYETREREKDRKMEITFQAKERFLRRAPSLWNFLLRAPYRDGGPKVTICMVERLSSRRTEEGTINRANILYVTSAHTCDRYRYISRLFEKLRRAQIKVPVKAKVAKKTRRNAYRTFARNIRVVKIILETVIFEAFSSALYCVLYTLFLVFSYFFYSLYSSRFYYRFNGSSDRSIRRIRDGTFHLSHV